MTENALKYAALFKKLAERAENVMEEGVSEGKCEILVKLYNDYLTKMKEAHEDLDIFEPIDMASYADPEKGLIEVMIRSEQLATWLVSERNQIELPSIESVSEMVDTEKMDEFAQDVQHWARSVSDKAMDLSRELSDVIPERLSHYFERGDSDKEETEKLVGKQWRNEILRRVQEGDLSVAEAVRLLEIDSSR